MAEKHDDNKSHKLAPGLRKLSESQLAAINAAIAEELKRRAKKAADNKPISGMDNKHFEQFKHKLFTGETDDGE